MKTICNMCFSNTFQMNDYLLKDGQLFWVGYLLCNPKIFSFRQNKYDLHINEVKEMNFDNLPVIFNHNKTRKSLGKVILTWHDHDDENLFSIGFLAVINNKTFLNSPASMLIMSNNSVSLSTLESDRTKPIELSITYCGARNGCLAVFVPKKCVWKWCKKFGLYRNSSLYKCKIKKNIDATFDNMTEVNENKTINEVHEDEKSNSLLSTLMNLPNDQYKNISENLKENQNTIEQLIQEIKQYKGSLSESKNDNMKHSETINLLSDFLTSMIKSRLELEKNSDSELALKKRKDFEELQNKNIFDDEGIPDLKHIKDLMVYCSECLCIDEPTEIETVNKVIESFKSYFPELQIPKGKTTVSTVDAAFEILNENVSKLKTTKDLIDRNKINQERALEIAKRNYDSLKKFSSSSKQNQDINDSNKSNIKKTMDFDEFIKENIYKDSDETLPPASKRQKLNNNNSDVSNTSSSNIQYSNDFYNYVKKKEEMRKRLDEYHQEYTKHVEKKNEDRRKQMDELLCLMPQLKEIIENIPNKPENNTTQQQNQFGNKQELKNNTHDQQFDNNTAQHKLENNMSQQPLGNKIPQQQLENNMLQQQFGNKIPQQQFGNNIPQQQFGNNIPQQQFGNNNNSSLETIYHNKLEIIYHNRIIKYQI